MSGNDLSSELAHAVRFGPFHYALSEAIKCRGLSLSRLRAHLASQGIAIGQSTLSYWQRGLRHPELPRAVATVHALEQVLRLPKDSLVVLIGPRRSSAEQPPGRVTFAELTDTWLATTALLSEFDAYPESRCNRDLEMLSVLDTVHIGLDGELASITARTVVRARAFGAERFIAVHQADPGSDMDAVAVTALDGCRIGRVRRQQSSAGVVFELLFDHRLAEGETHVMTFNSSGGASGNSPGYLRTLREPVHVYLLQLVFDPARLPVRCTRRLRKRENGETLESETLHCGAGGVINAYFSSVGPGIAGVDIEWD
ncbi:hypothetical protein [Amycolatopsis sp. H20-H5]|uniref:hypothetical protein n=1 Tax=Amycolatopsis sp. H20-H5 TaxID=3046309 RepID=UPI002DC03EAE|nr:hypothetical protein [Amycolatopsis sp. H20-H5]MEC3980110.1 hypothetical protein [Amycolatopsis sp. H20-H5]